MLINGKKINTSKSIKIRNPYNDKLIDSVSIATRDHVDKAVKFADNYDFSLTAWNRYEIIQNFCNILLSKKEKYINLICLESGKTIKEGNIEFERAYQTFLLSSEESKRINGEVLYTDSIKNLPSKMGIVVREPLGIVLAITPFNYPLNLVAHKVAPGIAANNPIILKPSSLTPLTALLMAEDLLKAGLPSTMLQVLTGEDTDFLDYLVTHPLIKKITFTGSVDIGKIISQKICLKYISLELGSNDPLIILRDLITPCPTPPPAPVTNTLIII